MGEGVAGLARRLAEPFPPDVIGWKPQTVSGARALAVAYIDARDVMDRLDAVVGPGGWRDHYDFLPCGSVVCTLGVRFDGEWVEKADVGGESDQKDEGDRKKAAVSDALKRAAVKFGIGRYIYRLDHQWADFDPKSKKIITPPRLPSWALPYAPAKAAPAPAPAAPPAPDDAHAVGEEVAARTGGRVVSRSTPAPVGVTGHARVTKAQVQLVEGLLASTGSDRGKFLKVFAIGDVADLNQEQYASALVKLEAKQRKAAQSARPAGDDPVGAAEREAIEAEARG
jgi:hypothetical protein